MDFLCILFYYFLLFNINLYLVLLLFHILFNLLNIIYNYCYLNLKIL